MIARLFIWLIILECSGFSFLGQPESQSFHREDEFKCLAKDSYFGKDWVHMKYSLPILLIFLLPIWGASQAVDHELDSLKRLLAHDIPPREAAEVYRTILWHIFRTEASGYEDFPERLDSLYRCCLKDQTGNPELEQLIDAEVVFFKGAAWLQEDTDSAQVYIERAVPLFGSFGDSADMAMSYELLAHVASAQGDSLAFASYYSSANKLVGHITEPDKLGLFHNNIGIACYDFGRYAEAASHYFTALAIVEKYQTPVLIEYPRDIYHNIAGVYKRLGDYNNSEIYILKAIEAAVARDQDPSDHYSMLGWIYTESGRHQLGLQAFQCVDDHPAITGRKAEKFFGLATCYRNLGQVETALPLARIAVQLLPITLHKQWGASAMQELAACEFAAGLIDEALEHALLAFDAFVNANNSWGKTRSAELLSNIYAQRGDFETALQYSEDRNQFQFHVERQMSSRQLAFGEFTRDNAAKTAQREAEVQAELNRQRYIRYALFAGLAILAILAYLLYNRYRFKQRTTEQLEIKNQEVETARRRAEASEAFKSRFLANMSHEIRTPLHGISGFTELLLDTSLSDKQRRWLSSIHYSTDRLSDVVNDILDISKLEAGEVKLREIPFSVPRLFADVQDALRMKAEKNNTHIQVSIAEDVPIALLGDPTRLYQILMNLAGNAVKFTENGTVTLSVKNSGVESLSHASLTPLTVSLSHGLTSPTPLTVPALSGAEGSLSHHLTFCVTDTGIGIPPERLSAIFESFQQAGEDTTARFGGTGLGLTIARELVRLHGSDIHVESEVGKGSLFYFSVTLPGADPDVLMATHEAGDTLYFKEPLRILLADDNALNREIAVEAIKRHFENAVVIEAVNGKEVVEHAEHDNFDVVLMDMQMPEMTGAEATMHIRTRCTEEKRLLPVIALTASATPEEIEMAIQSGMNRHLGKPFKSRELAQVIAETLGLTSLQKLAIENITNTDTIIPSLQPQSFDLSFLYEFTEGDRDQMIHFIQRFLDNYPKEVAVIEQALKDENREALYLAAHSFRPQLEFVGFKVAASLLLMIERGARDGISIDQLGAQFAEIIAMLEQLPQVSDWL